MDDSAKRGTSRTESVELRRRTRLLEQESSCAGPRRLCRKPICRDDYEQIPSSVI